MINPIRKEDASGKVEATQESQTPVPKSFHIHRNGKVVQISYEELFAAGHKLWMAKHYANAAKVFSVLSEVSDRGPRAHLFLAHCMAMLNDFRGCSGTLFSGLPSETYGNAAVDLHNVFIMWRCMFVDEIRQGLEKFIADYPDLATPCLMLGDFHIQVGTPSKSLKLYRQAIRRDRTGGSISRIAKRELSAISPNESV